MTLIGSIEGLKGRSRCKMECNDCDRAVVAIWGAPMQQFQNESIFDDQAQQEIIALAAQLQRQAGQSMSLSELERIAAEAGIEPRFVREAVTLRSSSRRIVSA